MNDLLPSQFEPTEGGQFEPAGGGQVGPAEGGQIAATLAGELLQRGYSGNGEDTGGDWEIMLLQ